MTEKGLSTAFGFHAVIHDLKSRGKYLSEAEVLENTNPVKLIAGSFDALGIADNFAICVLLGSFL